MPSSQSLLKVGVLNNSASEPFFDMYLPVTVFVCCCRCCRCCCCRSWFISMQPGSLLTFNVCFIAALSRILWAWFSSSSKCKCQCKTSFHSGARRENKQTASRWMHCFHQSCKWRGSDKNAETVISSKRRTTAFEIMAEAFRLSVAFARTSCATGALRHKFYRFV